MTTGESAANLREALENLMLCATRLTGGGPALRSSARWPTAAAASPAPRKRTPMAPVHAPGHGRALGDGLEHGHLGVGVEDNDDAGGEGGQRQAAEENEAGTFPCEDHVHHGQRGGHAREA